MEFAVTLSGEGPWGFRVTGGVESNKPLTVYKLISTGKAAEANIKTNDVIIKINDQWTTHMPLTEVTKIIRNTTRDLRLEVRRGTYYSSPVSPQPSQGQKTWNMSTSAVTMTTPPTLSSVSQTSLPTYEYCVLNSPQDKPKLWKPTAGNEVSQATTGNYVSPSSHAKPPIKTNEQLISQKDSTHNAISMATTNRHVDYPTSSTTNVHQYSPQKTTPLQNISLDATNVKGQLHSSATYEDAYVQRRDTVANPPRPHSAHIENYAQHPYTKQSSSPTYTPVIIRSPVKKAHLYGSLYGSNPDDADVESLCSTRSTTSNKEDIVREQQYEPMRSPTRVPGYYGRLQHEAELRDAKADSDQHRPRSSRVERDAYHSDGEVMRPQQLSKNMRRDRPITKVSVPKQNTAVMNRTPTRSRNGQSSSYSNGVVSPNGPFYGGSETNRRNTGNPSQQYHSDVEDRTRYISRSGNVPNYNQYYSDTEGQPRRRPANNYVAPSNQYYSDAEDYDRGNMRRSFLNSGHYQNPVGNTSRRRASADTSVHGNLQYNGTETNQPRATGEVIRAPQYTPRALNKPSRMPKYYDKIDALISDDAVAMSDTEAITPRYTRRRKGRQSEGNVSNLNQHQQSTTMGQKMSIHKNKENTTHGAHNDASSGHIYRSPQYQHSTGGTAHRRAPAPDELRGEHREWGRADSTRNVDYGRNAAPFNSEDKNTPVYQKHLPTHSNSNSPRSHGNQPQHVWASRNNFVVQNDEQASMSSQEIPKYTNPQYFSDSEADYYNTRSCSDSGPDPVHFNQQRRSTENVYNAIQDTAKRKPRSLNIRASDVYKSVHDVTPPGRPGRSSARFAEEFADDELEYYDYVNPIIQSPSFMKLHKILEVSEEK